MIPGDVYTKFEALWLYIAALDALSYIIAAGVVFFIFWYWKTHRWHHLFIQNTRPKSRRLWYEIKYSISTVFIFGTIASGTLWLSLAGYARNYSKVEYHGWPYWIFSLFLVIILHDAYFYWTHRIMHHPFLYKYVHKVHHMSTNPSPWAAQAFHPIEAVVQAGIFPLIAFTIPVHNVVFGIAFAYMIIMNASILHSGLEFFPRGFTKKRWSRWLATSTHHNMHHKHFDCNYGLYFMWWDEIMKTTHRLYHDTFEKVKSKAM